MDREGSDQPGYDLHDATSDDFEFVHEVRSAAFRPHVLATYGTWDDAEQRSRLEARWHRQRWQIIQVDGRHVGVLCVDEADDPVRLLVVVLELALRGRGIGTAVVRDVIERAASRGRGVQLRVLKTNDRARRLYERLGFTVTGRTDTHDLMAIRPPPMPR